MTFRADFAQQQVRLLTRSPRAGTNGPSAPGVATVTDSSTLAGALPPPARPRPNHVAASACVQRLIQIAVRRKPRAGAQPEGRRSRPARSSSFRRWTQDLAEQMMTAIPLPLFVHGHSRTHPRDRAIPESRSPLTRRSAHARYGGAQWAGQLIEKGSIDQEVLGGASGSCARTSAQQVVHDVAVAGKSIRPGLPPQGTVPPDADPPASPRSWPINRATVCSSTDSAITSRRNSAASSGSGADREHAVPPRGLSTRSRAMGKGGSSRLASTRCSAGGG